MCCGRERQGETNGKMRRTRDAQNAGKRYGNAKNQSENGDLFCCMPKKMKNKAPIIMKYSAFCVRVYCVKLSASFKNGITKFRNAAKTYARISREMEDSYGWFLRGRF